MALLSKGLLPASFRGAPFAVIQDDASIGRRLVVHEYPGRDLPYVEDMGRAARRFRLRGFIVDGDVVFAGGPIQLQRAQLIAALEERGPGTLTHPTLGILNVCVLRSSMGADLGAGRMSLVEIEFVESGKKQFPSLFAQDSGLLKAGSIAKIGLALAAVRAIAVAAQAGGTRVQLDRTAANWAGQVLRLGQDATALAALATRLPGNFGRYAGGGTVGRGATTPSIYSSATTVADLVGVASAARADLRAASLALGTAIAGTSLTDASAVAAAAQALLSALARACADPGDAYRLLVQLLGYAPARVEATSAMGVAMTRLMRRAAAAAIGEAVNDYQLSSSDEGARLVRQIADLFDRLIVDAADAGDDEIYGPLRSLRQSLVDLIRSRAGPLPRLRRYEVAVPLPALTLAQRWYGDAGRADELMAEGRPRNPLFMPTRIEGLAS